MAITEECREFLDSHFKLENYADAKSIALNTWSALFTVSEDFRYELSTTEQRDLLVRMLHDPLCKNEEIEPVWPDEAISELDYFSIYKVMDDRLQSPHFFETYFNDYRTALPRSEFNFEDQASWPRVNKYFCERLKSSHWGDPSLEATARGTADGAARTVDLNVDLTFPDDTLIKSFKLWLESRRFDAKMIENNVKKKKKFKVSDIETWNHYRTLQYIHVVCVQKFFKCELSSTEFCEYLFRDRIDRYHTTREIEYVKWAVDQRDIMRTVKAHGDMMMDFQNLLILENTFED
jgi:hypothetical protein